jgi:hypothetical protein
MKPFRPPLLKRRSESEESVAKRVRLGDDNNGQRDALKQISVPNSSQSDQGKNVFEPKSLDAYYLVLW